MFAVHPQPDGRNDRSVTLSTSPGSGTSHENRTRDGIESCQNRASQWSRRSRRRSIGRRRRRTRRTPPIRPASRSAPARGNCPTHNDVDGDGSCCIDGILCSRVWGNDHRNQSERVVPAIPLRHTALTVASGSAMSIHAEEKSGSHGHPERGIVLESLLLATVALLVLNFHPVRVGAFTPAFLAGPHLRMVRRCALAVSQAPGAARGGDAGGRRRARGARRELAGADRVRRPTARGKLPSCGRARSCSTFCS